MFAWLKDHFIPHSGNDHKPHFLRFRVATMVLGAILLIEAAYLANIYVLLPGSAQFAAIIAGMLVDQTNEKRLTDELGTLTISPTLVAAAKLKAEDMAEKGYFSHDTPDGKTPWDFLKAVDYSYAYAGENLAVNFTESIDVTEAWMRSPGHRANIMNGNYSEIGIATAQGVYKGKEAIFVVQFFGKPKPASSFEVAVGETRVIPGTTTDNVAGTTSIIPERIVASSSPELPPPVVKKKVSRPYQALSTTSLPTVLAAEEVATTTVPEIIQLIDSPSPTLVAGAGVGPVTSSQKDLIQNLLASPRLIVALILGSIAILIGLALILAVCIKRKIQHPRLIMTGVLLLTLIAIFLVLNETIGVTRTIIE